MKMNEEAEKALRGSMRKWEKIIRGEGVDDGADNCPLCALYYEYGCRGCPVARSTGRPECRGTPYFDWKSALKEEYRDLVKPVFGSFEWASTPSQVIGPLTMQAAIDEYDYLASLLPKRSE